jgi:hypothetical protein
LRYGIVIVSTADLRRRPSHKAEMVSQGLLGAVVRIESSAGRGSWLKVLLPDGYRGWMRSWNVAVVSKRAAVSWRRQAGALVRVASGGVYAKRRTESDRMRDLTLGCRLVALGVTGAWVRVLLPDGQRGWVRTRCLVAGGGALPATGGKIVQTARLFLGAPYLWGGVSPKGADCSGLVQTSFAAHGVELPRDVSMQCRCGEEVRGGLKPGDLMFFGPSRGPLTHVAVWAGRGRFIHAGCPVEEASLDPRSPMYRAKLRAQYRFSRRVLGARR